MNFLDIRTILINDITSTAVCTLMMALLWLRHRRKSPALSFWLASYVMHCVAVVLVVLRGQIPDAASVFLGVPLFLCGMLFLLVGLERYVGKNTNLTHLRLNCICLAISVLVQAWFTFAQPSLMARNLNLSLGMIIFIGQGAWLLLHGAPANLRAATRLAGWACLAFVIVSVLRVATEVAVPPGEDFFKSGLYDCLALITYQMLFVALTFALFLMVNHRLLTELENDIIARKQTEAALREARDQLEVRVQERTQELTRANIALSESEEKFRTMTASARDSIIMTDDSGCLIYWNEAAENMFGYTMNEMIGENMHMMLAPMRYHEDYEKGYKRFSETGGGSVIGKTLELSAKRKDGAEFPIELSVSRFQLQGRWHALGILRDITQRKQVEEDLRQARESLEGRVRERTAELVRTNEGLKQAQAETTKLLTNAEQSRQVLLSMVEDQKAAEEKMRQWSEDLRLRNEELERWYSTMVDRELRMIELKQEINEIAQRHGEPPPYPAAESQGDNKQAP